MKGCGVVNYIDRQLCDPFENLQDTYRRGLAAVDQSSQLAYGKEFIDLTVDIQFRRDLNMQSLTAAVDRIEGGIRAAEPTAGRIFIEAESFRRKPGSRGVRISSSRLSGSFHIKGLAFQRSSLTGRSYVYPKRICVPSACSSVVHAYEPRFRSDPMVCREDVSHRRRGRLGLHHGRREQSPPLRSPQH